MYRFYLICVFTIFFSCNDTSITGPPEPEGCGKGVKRVIQKGRELCVYDWEIVIETGFNCPVAYSQFRGFEPVFGVCSDFGDLEEIEIIDIFEGFDLQPSRLPSFFNGPPAKKLDLLFVVDNSGSMCQEQDRLSRSFDAFIAPLADVDFQLGITTTQLEPNYAPEPVAQPGYLQSQPQPLPGFDRSCVQDIDNNGKLIDGSFKAFKKRLAFAADCMKVPDDFYKNLSSADITCALEEVDTGCSIGNRCGGANGKCDLSDLVPNPSSYRSLPNVFKSADYQRGGELDRDKLSKDFRCALLVGTRGHGVEKGLAAAVLSVSKTLTGGAVGSPGADQSKPNHGFIRTKSAFGLVFVTDENDCSHDGSLDEGTSCGDAVCEYAIKDGGLIAIEKLKADLIRNLEDTKGEQLNANDIIVGSLHGRPTIFEGESRKECPIDTPTGILPACATASGVVFSGSRYADFLRAFGTSGYSLSQASPICREDWTDYFISMGGFFRSRLKSSN